MLVNYNYTLLKCDKCQKTYRLLPGEKYEKLEVECDCERVKREAQKQVEREKTEETERLEAERFAQEETERVEREAQEKAEREAIELQERQEKETEEKAELEAKEDTKTETKSDDCVPFDQIPLEGIGLDELREMAKAKGIKRYGNMKEETLRQRLIDATT